MTDIVRVERGREVSPGVFCWTCLAGGRPSLLEGRSRQPLLDACRAIKRMGAYPPAQQIGIYRQGRDQPDATCGLAWGAAHTVRERTRGGIYFAKWQSYAGR